jgi:hypothetical protein
MSGISRRGGGASRRCAANISGNGSIINNQRNSMGGAAACAGKIGERGKSVAIEWTGVVSRKRRESMAKALSVVISEGGGKWKRKAGKCQLQKTSAAAAITASFGWALSGKIRRLGRRYLATRISSQRTRAGRELRQAWKELSRRVSRAGTGRAGGGRK